MGLPMTNQQRTTFYLALAILSVVAIVCGGIGAVVIISNRDNSPSRTMSESPSSLPQTSNTTYFGRTVDDYGPQLLDLYPPIANDASRALMQMGPESLRWFYKGMKSPHTHVRFLSVAHLPAADATPYLSVFEPVLLNFLEADADEGTRQFAGVKLIAMQSAKGREAVRRKLADPRCPKSCREYWEAALKR
jgi:hypothetical protein